MPSPHLFAKQHGVSSPALICPLRFKSTAQKDECAFGIAVHMLYKIDGFPMYGCLFLMGSNEQS